MTSMNLRLRHMTASFPGVGVALVPKVVCPMCSPAYTALLSSMGLPFLATATYLFPLTVGVITVGVGSLLVGADRRRGLGPFWLGVTAAACLLGGRFLVESVLLVCVGIVLFIAASVWNATPKRPNCPACVAGMSD